MPGHYKKKPKPKPKITKKKAAKMLKHGAIRGKPLTKKQRGLFGAIAEDSSKRK